MTMKAFVFTLDAIFSVVFASIAVSILIYIHYTSYSPAQFQASQASASLNNFMESGASSMFNGSTYSNYLLAYSGTSQYSWPQYGANQGLSSSAPYGPTKPLLLDFARFSSNIIPDIAVSGAYGVAELTSNQIYIFNSTTLNGILYNTANAVISTPAIYGQSAIFATYNGYITAVSLSNAPRQIWSDNIGFNTISTPLDIEDNYLVFAATKPGSLNSFVYLIKPSNGTTHGVYSMGQQTINTIAYDGTFLVGSSMYNSIKAGNTISNIAAYGVGTYSSATTINAIGTASGNFLIYPTSGPNSYLYLGNYYIPVSITNGATSPTPSNFQQMVYFNPSLSSYSGYFAADLGNIRFYSGQTELYSWCESGCTSTSTNAVFWVNLGSTIIPAGNTITINATLLSTSVEYDGFFAGEAPQLSSTYAEYDNGAKVFNFYDDFVGASLNQNLWSSSQSKYYTVNNGIDIAGGGAEITSLNNFNPTDYVFDSYIEPTVTTGQNPVAPALYSSTGNTIGITTYEGIQDFYYNHNTNNYAYISPVSTSSYQVLTMWLTGNVMYGQSNYAGTNSLAVDSSFDTPMQFQFSQSSAATTYYTWVRLRKVPPNDVMPYVSAGTGVELTQPYSGAFSPKRIAPRSINTTLGGAAGNDNYSISVFSNDIVYTTPFSGFNYSNSKDSYNNTPSIAGSIAYMLLGSNRFVGFDASSGKILFNISLPYDFYSYPFSNIAISGGRAYVPDGNTLYAFGESTLPANTSALSALASLYIDHRGGLADALLSSIYNTTHIGIFINGTYAPSLSVSSFLGSSGSYITVPGGFTSPEASNHAMSMCDWFKINSLAGFNGIIFKGTASPSSGAVPEYSIGSNGLELGFNITSSSGTIVASANAPGSVSGNDIGHWMFSCMAYNASTSTAIYYLNGTAYYGTASNSLFATAGSGNMVIGAGPNGGSDIDLANVQLYKTNLTVANMGRLYYSGMFGSPLSGNGLVSWWPLLGDANDYYASATGFPYSVSYVPSGYISRQLLNAYQISGAGAPIPVYGNGTYSIRNVSVVIWS